MLNFFSNDILIRASIFQALLAILENAPGKPGGRRRRKTFLWKTSRGGQVKRIAEFRSSCYYRNMYFLNGKKSKQKSVVTHQNFSRTNQLQTAWRHIHADGISSFWKAYYVTSSIIQPSWSSRAVKKGMETFVLRQFHVCSCSAAHWAALPPPFAWKMTLRSKETTGKSSRAVPFFPFAGMRQNARLWASNVFVQTLAVCKL